MSRRKKHTFTLSEAAKKKLVLNLPYCMIGLCTSINYEKKRQLNSQRFMDHFLCVLRKMVRM